MHLIFDTETSGFLTPNFPYEHPRQGKILSIATLLLDEKFEEQAFFHAYVDVPDYVEISKGAFDAHGITKEHCKKYGIPSELAFLNVDALRAKSKYQVAHNIKFDLAMIHNEEDHLFGGSKFECSSQICTMERTTDLCKLTHPSGKRGYKWPKLEEAYKHIMGKEMENAHSALGDVRACATIYKWLVLEGHIEISQT